MVDYDGHAFINVILAAIGGLLGWVFGEYIANYLGYYSGEIFDLIRAGVAIGSAVVFWFAGVALTNAVTRYLVANPTIVI